MTKDGSPLALGFIGGSLHSAVGYAHRVSCAMDGAWRLEAGCFSRNQEENLATAMAYQIASGRTYRSWQELLASEKDRLDAVVVLTPTPTHAEIVNACLRAGVPVICEKSLATNVEDVLGIQSVLRDRKGFLAVTYNYTGYPMVRELRNMIGSGVLGRLLHFRAEMPQEGFCRVDAQGNKPVPQPWRLSDGRIPTIYLDLGVHLHQVVHYLIGRRPLEVVADQASHGWFGVADNVSCLCRYEDGVQGQMWFSKSALGHRNGLRFSIYGSAASAEWYQLNPEEIVVSFVDGRRQVIDRSGSVAVAGLRRYSRFKAGHPAGFVEAFANLYTDLADCLHQYKARGEWASEEVFSTAVAAEGLQMFEAMVSSVQSQAWKAVN
ncbi:MAG: Gfo/Idh/MocA family oxidoreductase [bacterium]